MGKKLIIKEANFYANAIEQSEPGTDRQVYSLVIGISLAQDGGLPANAPLTKNDRANVFVTKASAYHPITWGAGVPAIVSGFSYIEIPPGAIRATIRMTNSSYKCGLVLISEMSTTHIYDSGWKNGGADMSISVDVTNYPSAKYLTSTVAIIAGGGFSGETLDTLGWSIEWSFE